MSQKKSDFLQSRYKEWFRIIKLESIYVQFNTYFWDASLLEITVKG